MEVIYISRNSEILLLAPTEGLGGPLGTLYRGPHEPQKAFGSKYLLLEVMSQVRK